MHKLALVAFLTLALTAAGAAPKKKTSAAPPAPVTAAPQQLPHPMAAFLRAMTNDGKRQVTFRATAFGTHFFFEEPSGVTVYRFEKGEYVKHEFLKGAKLAGALKKYAKK